MKYKLSLIIMLLLLLLSCGSAKKKVEAVTIDSEYLYQLPYPYELLEKQIEQEEEIYLLDILYYQDPLDFLAYMIPLLYKNDYRTIDLWFIPLEQRESFENWLYAAQFDRQGLIALLKDISYTALQERYIELMQFLWDFQHSLEESDAPLRFTLEDGAAPKIIHLQKEIPEEADNFWFLYGFGTEKAYPLGQIYQPEDIIARGGSYRAIQVSSESERSALMVLYKNPGDFYKTSPLIEEITQQDIAAALKEFSWIRIEKPQFLALKRIRKELKKQIR